MRKIAYVLSSFPVLSETFVGTEIRAMERCGHEVTPFALADDQVEYQCHDEPLRRRAIYLNTYHMNSNLKGLFCLKKSFISGLIFAFKQKGLRFHSLIWSGLKLAYLAKQQGCNHFHAHFAQHTAAIAIVAARFCGASVSFVGHGYDVYASPADLRLKLESVDFSVAVCKDMLLDFKKQSPHANVELIYCGIEANRFPLSSKAYNKQGRLIFVGRLCETKGVDNLIYALCLIKEAQRPHLDIVGDGVLKSQLQEICRELNLEKWVNFLGSKQSTWLSQHSCEYSALVMPFRMATNGDRDTGPVIIKEAMSMGLPIITTYFMGCKEMLTEECAIRIEPDNIKSLAQAILQLKGMEKHEIDIMTTCSYHRVNQLFTSDIQAKKLSNTIEDNISI
ncbi:glycosyltransferase [Vibrio sp. Of7-15]|uniref:glycosyltransferase n=1 Tax=Vibrio sp. Of7-15 TaxID=2724879 RepID=UPI001EF2D29B|nr:glycosyltransferase [Vibrio sp. Of7-15]MCG7496240.1 glycosyltransferase [Vibrio sp. Of7-15]